MGSDERKSKRKYTFAVLLLILLACGIGFGIAFQNDLQRPRMRHANIPEFMHEAIRLHNGLGLNHYVADVHFGPSAWPNDKDYGQKNDWDKEEKECFIVYYHRDEDGVWQLNAQSLLTELARSKQIMQEEMKFFFMNPQRINGRKLAFYLPTTEMQYDSVVKKLAKSYADSIISYNDSRMGGFMYSEFGPLGFKPVGIVIKPSSFDIPMNETNSYRAVAIGGLAYYESWALADQALVLIEKIPFNEIAEQSASTKLNELSLLFSGAKEIGSLMKQTMATDSTYSSLAKNIDSAATPVEPEQQSSEAPVQEDAPNEEPADSEEE